MDGSHKAMDMLKGKVFKNASWIIACKLLQSVIGLCISFLTARYLGPSNYGLISYASSLVAFVLPIAQLGLKNTLVQEITGEPENEGRILGTAISFSVASSVFCILGVVAFSAVANFGDVETVVIVALYSINLVFQAVDLVQCWFQAKLFSKYSSIASLIAYVIVSFYKVYLLVASKSVYWFAVSTSVDYFLIALLLMLLYRSKGGRKFCFDWALGKRMLEKSKHYIVTGLMVAIFAQTDKIMLKGMIGEAATGNYSVAVTVASVSSFVYIAIIDSFRPVIFSAVENKEKFELNLKRLYSIVIWLSLLQCVVTSVFAEFIIDILYGEEFASAANILRAVVWFITFSYLGSIRNIWILAKNKQKYLWVINASGAALNVILNLVLIPYLGGVGAAIVSVITQLFTNFIIGFIMPPIRENNSLILQALNPKIIYGMIKSKE